MKDSHRPLGPRERWVLGGMFVGMGLFIVWLSVSDPSSVNGPWWIGTSAGLVFVAAGLAAGTQGTTAGVWVTPVAVAVVFLALAAIGNWIAFGPGPRACSVGISFAFLGAGGDGGGMGCRGAFGFGAVILDAVLVAGTLRGVARLVGSEVWSRRAEAFGTGLVGIVLSPLILLTILGAVLVAVKEKLFGRR